MKCKVCGSVMFPDLHREGVLEELRYRCLKDCRGSELSQIRQVKGLPKQRRITSGSLKSQEYPGNKYGGKTYRTFICKRCNKTISRMAHPRERFCNDCKSLHYKEIRDQQAKELYWKNKRIGINL